jgi:hypothetical protein
MILGDFTEWCKSILYRELDKIINRFQGVKDPYWILILTKPHYTGPTDSAKQTKDVLVGGNVINTRFVVILNKSQLPAFRQIGTALLKVDNKAGQADWVYILPRDLPFTQPVEFGEESMIVAKSAQELSLMVTTAKINAMGPISGFN